MTASGHVASWYAATAHPAPVHAALDGSLRCDVAVLGAGITGLSTALELAERGYDVVVLDAERVGWGASGRNGGQALFGFGCEQSKIAALVGRELARQMFDWSLEGLDLLRQRCAQYAIDCDWRAGHAHVAIKPRHVDELQGWQRDLRAQYGYDLPWWDREQLRAQLDSPRYRGGLYDANSGHLHPLNYTLGLARAASARGVRICEHSAVTALQPGARPRLVTARGDVEADHLVLAGNAYLHGIAPMLEARIMPVGTYIAATAPLGARARQLIRNDMAVADINWALDYFRCSADDRLLFGGRASYSGREPRDLRRTMQRRMQQVFPQLDDVRLDYVWGGYVDISRNRAPHWGRLDPQVYYAQGFSGHGVVAAGLAGRVIAEAIHGQQQRLDAFARIPHRPFPGGQRWRTPLLVAAMSWFKLRDMLW